MENIGIALGITGGILGIIAFFGQWLIALFKYVDLDINAEKETQKTGKISIRITLENKNILRKKVDFAALIISPENEPILTTLQKISKVIEVPDSFEKNLKYLQTELNKPYYLKDRERAIIPLPFIFSELHYIEERTVYRCSLDTSQLEKQKYYSVKLLTLYRFMFGIRKSVVQELIYVG